MEVSVGEDPVDSAADRAKFGHGALFDADPAGEIFVAVEETGGPIQSVSGVVNSGALLRCLVSRAEEDPLFCGRHLTAGIWLAITLELDGQTIQLHAELSQVFVLPDSFVLGLWSRQDMIDICNISPVKSAKTFSLLCDLP